MVDRRPGIAFISCNTVARLLSMCTKCEESRANGIGRPPDWIPLFVRLNDFAMEKFTQEHQDKGFGSRNTSSQVTRTSLLLRQLSLPCQDTA